MSTANVSNGRPQRKQLSDQLDRLDGVIDALADGLNKAVADAAREGSREAVKEILTELLTNPDILTMIRSAVGSVLPTPTPPVPAPAEPQTAPRSGGFLTSAATAVAQGAKTISKSVAKASTGALDFVKGMVRTIRQNPRLRKALVIGAGIGLGTVVIASTNHTLASTLSGVGAAATAVAVQVGCWFRNARRRLGIA